MHPSTERHHGLLRDLTTQECWDHLTSTNLGRIAYADRDGPIILPFNYAAHDGMIWLRTTPYSDAASALPGQRAAFAVDHTDAHQRTGWSVMVRGLAAHVSTEDYPDLPDETPDPTPWPEGTRSMLFRLTPTAVSGRALRQPDVSPLPGHGPGTTQRHADHEDSVPLRA